MNMIATKPVRYVGRHEGMGPGERLLRLAAAGLRLRGDRRSEVAPARLPRSPEEITARLGEVRGASERTEVVVDAAGE